MKKGFLDIIKKEHGSGNYSGDEFGGGRGTDGSGMPTGKPGNFMFATGIECSYPTIENGKVRRDLLEECGHYERFEADLHLIKDLGLKAARYGLPYYKIARREGRYDWEFADRAMALIKKLELTPILDLMHFGVPDWVGDFQNPELPVHFAKYCAAVARRIEGAKLIIVPKVKHLLPPEVPAAIANLIREHCENPRRDDE